MPNRASLEAHSFEDHIRNALSWFHNPQRLGEESPLASAYILGDALPNSLEAHQPRLRGEAL